MPRSYETITLQDAKRMLAAAEAKADSLGIAYNVAVVDAGGHLLAFFAKTVRSSAASTSRSTRQ